MWNYCPTETAIMKANLKLNKVVRLFQEAVLARDANFQQYWLVNKLLVGDLDVDSIQRIMVEGGVAGESFFANVNSLHAKREYYSRQLAIYNAWLFDLTDQYLEHQKVISEETKKYKTTRCTCQGDESDSGSSTSSLGSDHDPITPIGTSASVDEDVVKGGVHATSPPISTCLAANGVITTCVGANEVGRNVVRGGEEEEKMAEAKARFYFGCVGDKLRENEEEK